MSFERKWVSDSNLDKLWHDTLEKKEANKQRGSPDFCKEAILGATLKRISSEMLMRGLHGNNSNDIELAHLDSNTHDELSCSDIDDSLCLQNDVFSDVDEESDLLDYKVLQTCKLSKMLDSDSDDTYSNLSNHASDLQELSDVGICFGESPKRRWSEVDEENEEDLDVYNSTFNDITSSPAKRFKCSERTADCATSSISNNELCDISHKNSVELTNHNCDTTATTNHTVLSPVKSVVSSISSLSLETEAHWSSVPSDSWCLPVVSSDHTDPLEIDSFFYKLKKVAL